MMNKFKCALLILINACCSLLPLPAGASGLGEISAISPLGDRFRAEIPLLNPSSAITAACFSLTKDSPDAIDGIPWLTNAQIAVASDPPRLVISSRRQVVDPVIQMAIHSSCDASLMRHYTALLSPPADRSTELPVTDYFPGDIQQPSARSRPDIAARDTPHFTRNRLDRTARAGETIGDMARRKFPRSRQAEQRFIRQMVALNPEWLSSESGEDILPEGIKLRYPTPSVSQAKAARQASQAKPAKRKPETPAGARDRLVLMPFDPPPAPQVDIATPGGINKQLSDVELQINTMRTEINKLRAEYSAPSPAIQIVLLEMESRVLAVELNAAQIALDNLKAERLATAVTPAPELSTNLANSENLAVQAPQPAPPAPLAPPALPALPAPIAVKAEPWAATLLTANTGLLVLLGLLAFGLSAIFYRRTGRGSKELLSTSTQGSPAADGEPHIDPIPAKMTVSSSSSPSAQAESRKEPEPPMASRVDETPMTSSVNENPMEIEHAIELADIFLTYGRTQDALDVLHNFMQDNAKESLRPSLMMLNIYKQSDMRQEFEHLADQLANNFKVKRVQWDDTPSPAFTKPGKSSGPGRQSV